MRDEHRHFPVPGLALVVLGILFLLANLGVFRIRGDLVWTYVLIILGLAFWIGFFFDRSRIGTLMPGSVLLTIGLLFHYTSTHGWSVLSYLWPFFLLAPAFGFYAMFIFGSHEMGLLVPAGILTVLAVFFFLQSSGGSLRLVWPVALIAVGVLLLFRKGTRHHDDRSTKESEESS
jgi:hypothetical protein